MTEECFRDRRPRSLDRLRKVIDTIERGLSKTGHRFVSARKAGRVVQIA